jgi:hypothetical protein
MFLLHANILCETIPTRKCILLSDCVGAKQQVCNVVVYPLRRRCKFAQHDMQQLRHRAFAALFRALPPLAHTPDPHVSPASED